MSLTDRIVRGFKAQFLSKIVTAIAGAVLTAVLARLLDPNGYGLFALALTIFGTFKLIARLGIAGSAGRYVAEYRENTPEQIPHIVRFSLVLNLGTIAATAAVVVVSYQLIIDVMGAPGLQPFLVLGTAFLAVGTIQVYLQKVLQGFEDIRFVAVLKTIEPASRLVFALGFVLAGYGALGAVAGYLAATALTALIGFVYLYKRVQGFETTGSTMESGLRRRIAEYAVPLTATNSAYVLDKRLDTLLVGAFLSPVEVGFYVLADRVAEVVQTPTTALGFTLSPMFGSEKAAGNLTRISRVYEMTLIKTLLLYIPMGAGIVLVADPLIRLLFGPGYAGAVGVLQVLGLFVVFKAITKLTDNGLNYLGRARDRAIVRGATALLNVALNLVLIPRIGVTGAAVATVISYGIYTGANLYIVSLELNLRPRYLLTQVGTIVAITVVMVVAVSLLRTYIDGWLTLFSVVGVGALVWGLLAAATGMLELKKIRAAIS